MQDDVISTVIAGIGGQGVLKASDILSEAAFTSGYDVKKSELHGMSQRGGSVSSDVRFGDNVLSPMVPIGEADYLVVLREDQVEVNRHRLADDGELITTDAIDVESLPNKKSLNVALLGVLSTYLDIPEGSWLEAIKANLPTKFHEANEQAFSMGRQAGRISVSESGGQP